MENLNIIIGESIDFILHLCGQHLAECDKLGSILCTSKVVTIMLHRIILSVHVLFNLFIALLLVRIHEEVKVVFCMEVLHFCHQWQYPHHLHVFVRTVLVAFVQLSYVHVRQFLVISRHWVLDH